MMLIVRLLSCGQCKECKRWCSGGGDEAVGSGGGRDVGGSGVLI